MKRAAFFVDGFNVYHAIDELKQPHLKWLNHWRLAEIIIPSRDESLVSVTFCTAYYPGDTGKRARHERLNRALKNVGVTVLEGHYVKDPMKCNACPHTYMKPTEKETDINVALSLYDGACSDLYDHAYLMTADSDQVATARFFKQRFPDKKLTVIAPPRRPHSQEILGFSDADRTLTADLLDKAVFPHIVPCKDGKRASVLRPQEYDPPAGWVHPDDRPKPVPKASS